MIKISLTSPFRLPRVGSDVFARLMRAKLKYDKTKGVFSIQPDTDLMVIITILKEALKDEIVLELQCAVCKNSAGCAECEFADACDRTNVSSLCICKRCMEDNSAYNNYCNVFQSTTKG